GPHGPVDHECTQADGYWVCLDDALDGDAWGASKRVNIGPIPLQASPIERRLLSRRIAPFSSMIAKPTRVLYGECMARLVSTTVRLHEEDVRALKRARAAGHSASELVRKGLRVVASRYYKRRRPPSTLLFESTDTKLGDESELFRDLER